MVAVSIAVGSNRVLRLAWTIVAIVGAVWYGGVPPRGRKKAPGTTEARSLVVEGDRPVIQPVILAGGSGTRLWPASRQSHPKQLLVLTGSQTMLQQTALRLEGFAQVRLAEHPVLVTNEEYRFIVADQLSQVGITEPRIVLEPVGRNTAPALTVAALLCIGESDPVLLEMPSDHLISDLSAFHEALAEGAQLAAAGAVVAFGVTPVTPETGYGYIRSGDSVPGAASARRLAAFTEKPDAETARRYLAEGDYTWNSGMYMIKCSVWLAALETCRPDIAAACRAALAEARSDGVFLKLGKEAFTACPSESIDYAVMEHLGRGEVDAAAQADAGAADADRGCAALQGVVVPLDAGWSDVGAWDAVWTMSVKDESGNVVSGNAILEDARDTLVQANSRLVAALGVQDLAIIETADAVLVARRDRTADLKKLVDKLRAHDETITQVHRRVYRPWGWYESIDQGPRFQVKRLMVAPGARLSLQYHRHRAEHWVVVRGVAEVTCDERVFRLEENESTYVPQLSPHRLANPGTEPVEIIEVQSGDYLGEDDIVRLEDRYGRVEEK
jgi:mannose-1-phosphate guanylyltransferase / mannose-6-phosphate isomerase